MQYNATALSDKFDNGRSAGNLNASAGSLIFKDTSEQTFKMPIRGIELRIGGAGNRYLFFTHPQVPGITFYTDDKTILNSSELAFEPELKSTIRKFKNKNKLLWTIVSVFIGLIVVGIISLFVFKNQIIEHIAELVPPEKEQEIATSMKTSALVGKDIVKDSNLIHQLDLITDPLVKALNDTQYHFNFTIIKDPTLNAFALPGGSVIIHSGLIEKAKSPEEIAGVLAHEISHVTKRHHIRGVIGKLGIFMIVRSC
ncbi:MAG: M48 family metallopeptidase [Bacteroidia bacterium]